MTIKLLFLLVLISLSRAALVQWTGGAGNSLWSFATNWDNNAVPTANDDVVINAMGGASVSVSQPAVARSVTVAGGAFAQTLTLLNQLTVGAGGIVINSGGFLQVESNTNLPLSSTGPVIIKFSASLNFQSGSINGPGFYTVQAGGSLLLTQASLKQIASTTLVNYGQATIQATTIALVASGSFVNYGNVSASGQIQVNTDTSATSFQNYGKFIYTGQAAQPLIIYAASTFTTDLDIISGAVTLAGNFWSNASVVVPAGSVVTVVNAGASDTATLNVIKGTGGLVVSGTATVNGPTSLNSLIVTDSGTIAFNTGVSFTTAYFGGNVHVQSTLSLTNLTLAGGNIAGPGTTSISSYLTITQSDTANSNNFISSNVILYGQGIIDKPVYLLLGSGGILHVAQAATLNILAGTTITIQGGNPLVIVDGTIAVTLPLAPAQLLTSNVNFQGQGTLKVNAGYLTFSGNTVTLGALFLSATSFFTLQSVVATIDAITGSGAFNLTAAPAPTSSLGTIAIDYLGVPSGAVNINSFAVTKFEFWNGAVTLASGTTSTATLFNYYGGQLTGNVKLNTYTLNIYGVLPISFSGLAIVANTFTLQSPGTGSVQFSNGATIVAAASSPAPEQRAGGVVIN